MDVMLLTHSDRGLSFSALSQTKKADVKDEHISSALHAHFSEVDLSGYSETDFAFDILEGGRVEAPVPAVDDSSVLSEVWPFSEKEGDKLSGCMALNGDNLKMTNSSGDKLNGYMALNGDNLKMTNGDGDKLNGDVALNSDNLNVTNGNGDNLNMTNGNGDMAFNSDNLKMTNVSSEGVGCGCTEHVSEPLDTKCLRLVPRHLSTSALDTRTPSSVLRNLAGEPHMAPHGSHMAPHGLHMAPHSSHMGRTWPRDLYNSIQQLDATDPCSSLTKSSCVLAQIIHKHSGTAQVTSGRPGWLWGLCESEALYWTLETPGMFLKCVEMSFQYPTDAFYEAEEDSWAEPSSPNERVVIRVKKWEQRWLTAFEMFGLEPSEVERMCFELHSELPAEKLEPRTFTPQMS
eukprot:gene7049-144_t